MSYANNDEYKIYLNNTLIGTGSFIEIFESVRPPNNLCLAYDGGDGPEIILEIGKKFITVDLDKKEIHLNVVP